MAGTDIRRPEGERESRAGTAPASKGFGRNALLAAVSWVIPAVVAFVSVPITVRGLGDDAYGVMALVGAVTGYLGLMELGLGNGVVRYLSMFLANGQGKAMRECVRLVLGWFAVAGVLGTGGMWIAAPFVAERLLKMPAGLGNQATAAFRIGGAAFALGMLVTVLALLPRAFLRFDLIAWLNGGLVAGSFAGPAVMVALGYGLLPVMWFSVALNAVAVVVWGVVGSRLIGSVPDEGPHFAPYRREFIGFSIAGAANRTWNVIQAQTSRMVVGIAGGTAQAAYFQVPNVISSKSNELLNRMAEVLLPTGAHLSAEGKHEAIVALYERTSRLFYVLNASIAGAMVVLAAPLLEHWIGPTYAKQGAIALALLTLSQAFSATSMSASQINMALGRPKTNLVFSVLNSAVNLATVYSMTVAWGIAGTAASGLIAAGVTPFFLHYTHRRIIHVSSWKVFRECYLNTTLAVIAVSVLAWVFLRPLAGSLVLSLVLVVLIAAAAFLASAFAGALTPEDWLALRSALGRRPAAAGAQATDGATAPGRDPGPPEGAEADD